MPASRPGLINTSQQIGGAIGVAAATTIAATYTSRYLDAHPGASPGGGPALTHGFEIAFYVLAAVAVFAAVVCALVVESKPQLVDEAEAARRRGARSGGCRMTGRRGNSRPRPGSQGEEMNLNIAARAGRWSAAHWKAAVSAWLAFCIVAIALGAVAGTKMLKQADTAAGGTKTAERMLGDAGFPDRAGESVLVQSKTQSIGDPAFRAAVADVARSVSRLPQVQRVRSPLDAANAGQVSKNRHSALVQFEIRGDQDKADKKVQPVLDAVAASSSGIPASPSPSSASPARRTS